MWIGGATRGALQPCAILSYRLPHLKLLAAAFAFILVDRHLEPPKSPQVPCASRRTLDISAEIVALLHRSNERLTNPIESARSTCYR